MEIKEMCNGRKGVSLGNYCAPESDCIPSLKSHRKALDCSSVMYYGCVRLLLFLYYYYYVQ